MFFQLSASDLVGYLACPHLSELDQAVAEGRKEKPKVWDPLLEVLWERGAAHERDYVQHLKEAGFDTLRIDGVEVSREAISQTLDAMKSGIPVIVQGALAHDGWIGRTDILRRVETPSALGNWSYEAMDTKLARKTKARAVLQLCLYSDLLRFVQNVPPLYMYVVTPPSDFQPQAFRYADYAAYFRKVQRSLRHHLASSQTQETYPDPKEHCDICRWHSTCDQRRRDDDHLCLVAGISKFQINELRQRGITTLTALSQQSLPLTWKPERGSKNAYERIREQARIQAKGRASGRPMYELLPVEQGFGLTRLPVPSAGDIFLDLEGDPFVGEHGLEYLFGYQYQAGDGQGVYTGDWAFSRTEEKQAFEAFVDFVMARWKKHPDLHVYHSDWLLKIRALIERLTADVPIDPEERTEEEQQARWILANILDWHRREDKAVWWEYFRLADLSAEELLDERAAISGLTFQDSAGGTARAPIHRYRFPPQETDIRGGEDLRSLGGQCFGKVEAISLEARTVDIKKRQDTAAIHAAAVFEHTQIPKQVLADALVRIGEYVTEHGIEGDGPYRAARDSLLRQAPRLNGESVRTEGETTLDAALRLTAHLSEGIFPIQGPPGAGKTYTAARMICAFVDEGKAIGITANSHKVIRNVIDGTIKAAQEMGVDLKCCQKTHDVQAGGDRLWFTSDNGAILGALGNSVQVGGGTAWLWAREDAANAVDVLIVDEAAQMSLADVLAVSHAAPMLILIGDPRQLEQPMQGSHPDGTDVSALDHILDGVQTIPPDRGLFLEETWRLHPEICAFTSELFYAGKLRSREGLHQQTIEGLGPLSGAGLRYLPVEHEGNRNSSPEEAQAIHDLVMRTLGSGARWIDRAGKEHLLRLEDILIITPYNAQIFEIQQKLPGARVGTVDKFQGQEAPISIYSTATSSHADAPRGMEFLYSLNRFNVATSRAKCLTVLVGSPQIFEAECRTPRQMQLANTFCRYAEMAAPIDPAHQQKLGEDKGSCKTRFR